MAIQITRQELKKLKPITSGGEANIYEFSSDKLLKEFKPNVNLSIKEQKVDMFLNSGKIANLTSPSDKVLLNGGFIGYLMDKVKNPEVYAMLSKVSHLKVMNFSYKDVIDILLDTANTFEQIHNKGFIIGDISDQNILLSGKEHSFIDSDSFGFIGKFAPDVYTEVFTDPNAYCGNSLKQTIETDKYAFAILVFKTLTRIHPFDGTYPKDEFMNPVSRMANKISVLGNHDVKIPSMIPSWNWLSPSILNTFLEVFEKGKRVYLKDELSDLQSNLKFCKAHGGFYYGKYSQCPICNSAATVVVKPTVVKAVITNNVLALTVTFEANNISYILDFDKYLSNNGEMVSIQGKTGYLLKKGKRVEFLDNGATILEISDETIDIIFNGIVTSKLPRAYKSSYKIVNNVLYYVDESFNLSKVKVTKSGNMKDVLLPVYTNTIFSVSDNGKYCAVLLYPKKGLIALNSAHITFDYEGKITEYAIKYDSVTGNWLFVYKTNTGEFRTIIVDSSKIIFDSRMFRYSATPLSNICFSNNNIFAPSDKKIVGINWSENRVKEFDIDVVQEDSKIDFVNGGFNIISGNKIYRYGK